LQNLGITYFSIKKLTIELIIIIIIIKYLKGKE
jgi:hypothetical protein